MKKTDINKKKFWEKNYNFWKKKLICSNEFDSFLNHINCFLLNFWSWVFLINKMMKKNDKNKKKFWEKNDNFWKKKLIFSQWIW